MRDRREDRGASERGEEIGEHTLIVILEERCRPAVGVGTEGLHAG